MVPCNHTVVVCVVRGGGGPAEHGTLKMFSSSLMPILVEAEYLTTGDRMRKNKGIGSQ